jgi:hypothetical protein
LETDLRISIYFAKGDEQHAPEGMGWYIAATYLDELTDGLTVEVIPRVRLPAGDMEKVAKVLDKFASGKPMNWLDHQNYKRGDSSLEAVVHSANDQAKDLLAAKLAEAEEAVRRIEALRARAGEFE